VKSYPPNPRALPSVLPTDAEAVSMDSRAMRTLRLTFLKETIREDPTSPFSHNSFTEPVNSPSPLSFPPRPLALVRRQSEPPSAKVRIPLCVPTHIAPVSLARYLFHRKWTEPHTVPFPSLHPRKPYASHSSREPRPIATLADEISPQHSLCRYPFLHEHNLVNSTPGTSPLEPNS